MNFAVFGAGAWGTAFAVHLARVGHAVTLVPRRAEHAARLANERRNADYLPGIEFPPGLTVSADAGACLAKADVVMVACPAQALRETAQRLRGACPAGRAPRVVSLVKGLEAGTHLRPSEVIVAAWPGIEVCSLAGPTNALEVARQQPSAMVLASTRPDSDLAQLQSALSSPTLRVYSSSDLAGLEIGGCLKNVYAIAAGCCDGLKLGDNTKAALLTRALTEMVRVGVALGSRPETFYGLSGFGDLVATCYGAWSRNREFGQRIGEGSDVGELAANRRTVVEGHRTADAFAELCAERSIDAPILREVRAILYEGKKPAAALAALMTRELKAETQQPWS
jgi:glycerol-3-phosphate dehydrogenase (NAD(P)+)